MAEGVMPRIRAAESATIRAPAQKAYAIIADYRVGHPRIVPPRFFSDMEVEQGGVGAGTVIRFKMKMLGMTRLLRAEITEPNPGRLLVESYPATGEVTTFTVEPIDGDHCNVTITTEWTRGGMSGLMQRMLVPSILRRVFREELARLAAVAAAFEQQSDH
jgi:hypothetical protein